MIGWLRDWVRNALHRGPSLSKDVEWTSRYMEPGAWSERPGRTPYSIGYQDIEKARADFAERTKAREVARREAGDNTPVINDHSGWDGLTEREKAAWLAAYRVWETERARSHPNREQLVHMDSESFREFVRMRAHDPLSVALDALIAPVKPPADRMTEREWLEDRPGQGLVVLAGVNLRTLGKALIKMERGEDLTPYEKELIASRPGLTPDMIDRQMRTLGVAPLDRTPTTKMIEGETHDHTD